LDRAWRENWMFHRLMQAYLELSGTVDGLVDAGLECQADRQSRRSYRLRRGSTSQRRPPPLTNFERAASHQA
jgi:hypothetical protein